MSITSSSSHHVRVVVRTKPTANFTQDLIKLEDDGKVRMAPTERVARQYRNLNEYNWCETYVYAAHGLYI